MDLTNHIEYSYSTSVNLEHRKRYAQFFTPAEVADVMTNWLLGNKNLTTVLEPAFGLGIFSRILLSKKFDLQITGCDVDCIIYKWASELFRHNCSVDLALQDYINEDWNKQYDGIICNPPYLKFHDYENKKVIPVIKDRLGINLRGQTNLYALFLLKSLNQLNYNGRCAYLVPSEFLNSDYGVLVKEHLIQSGKIRHIIIFNFKENVFDDALTTSAILLCANDDNSTQISFSNLNDIIELDRVNQIISSYPLTQYADYTYNISDLKADVKWRNYYQPQSLPKFKNLVSFATYGKVMRGIATGANSFFSFNKTKAQYFQIGLDNLQPCICHSTDILGLCFTPEDFRKLLENDKNVYILNPNNQTRGLKTYIELGEREKVHKGYLVSKRNPWYSMEKRLPSPIWVSVFNRTGLRFVRNETSTLNLTTFHCVYVNNNLFDVDPDLLFAYLISDTAKQLFSVSRREYGNGLSKFEPNDLNKSYMLDIGSLNQYDKNRLREIYRENKKSDNRTFIEDIDTILNDHFLIG